MKSSPYGLCILGYTCATITKTTCRSNFLKKNWFFGLVFEIHSYEIGIISNHIIISYGE